MRTHAQTQTNTRARAHTQCGAERAQRDLRVSEKDEAGGRQSQGALLYITNTLLLLPLLYITATLLLLDLHYCILLPYIPYGQKHS